MTRSLEGPPVVVLAVEQHLVMVMMTRSRLMSREEMTEEKTLSSTPVL
jgi:hypothetical protein